MKTNLTRELDHRCPRCGFPGSLEGPKEVTAVWQSDAMRRQAIAAVHDINNLLATVLLAFSVMRDQGEFTPDGQSALAEAESAIVLAANLAGQVLSFSRGCLPEGRRVEMRGIVSEAVKMFRPLMGQEIVIELEFCDGEQWVKADADLLKTVMINLAVNARDSMSAGGKLSLKVQRLPVPGLDGGPEAVCLSISDTGCGIEPETARRMFEPYFTTKDAGKGSGLGLAIVDQVIRHYKGRIEVETALGQGSTFRLFLPALLG